jgi:miniconductance mechanosensitive channel
MLDSVANQLISWGISQTLALLVVRGLVIALIVLLAFLANLIAKRFILRAIDIISKRTTTEWDDILLKAKVFERLSHLAPALVIIVGAPLMFPEEPSASAFVKRVAAAYIIFIGALVIDALLTGANDIYQTYKISRERPIKAYLQVVKIVVFLLTGIFIVATLINHSPWALLSGLGAMTAIIMLVFKDSILGFVASIQLVANNMIRPGDWIEMSKFGADGDVIDVTIHTVKVRNWDKTISTIPTYALVNDSFKNWRGMQESGGRRIKRALNIDVHSIAFCSEELIERCKRIEHLKDYVEERLSEIENYNSEKCIDTSEIVNGRRLTNVGVFRKYIENYLRNNPKIHLGMTFLVRHLAPTESGLPIEIYVFSNDQVWANYEGIQADIFDHILAVAPEFGLRVFQNPTGADFRALGNA